jgi:hypothetical protein
MRDRMQLLWKVLPVAALLMGGAGVGLAQDAFYVTGVSEDGAAILEDAEGNRTTLNTLETGTNVVEQGVMQVSSEHQLMLVTDSGIVVLGLGPAKFACGPGNGRTHLVLDAGKLIVASTPNQTATPLVVSTPADQNGARAVEALVAPGSLYFQRSRRRTQVAYLSEQEAPAALAVKVNGKLTPLDSGQLLTVDGTEVHIGPAAEWLASEDFDSPWGVSLGVASAQAARPKLESALFTNITSWDVYGGKEYVTSRLEAGRFRPEIRQVVTTVTTPQRPVSPAAGVPETSGFPAANEVPLLSPAALSVIDPSANVTAILLNQQASRLLRQTGSRGLGFRGLSQLAIPGFLRGGSRTVGPAGLGAQN